MSLYPFTVAKAQPVDRRTDVAYAVVEKLPLGYEAGRGGAQAADSSPGRRRDQADQRSEGSDSGHMGDRVTGTLLDRATGTPTSHPAAGSRDTGSPITDLPPGHDRLHGELDHRDLGPAGQWDDL
jgi:hypothetical protein